MVEVHDFEFILDIFFIYIRSEPLVELGELVFVEEVVEILVVSDEDAFYISAILVIFVFVVGVLHESGLRDVDFLHPDFAAEEVVDDVAEDEARGVVFDFGVFVDFELVENEQDFGFLELDFVFGEKRLFHFFVVDFPRFERVLFLEDGDEVFVDFVFVHEFLVVEVFVVQDSEDAVEFPVLEVFFGVDLLEDDFDFFSGEELVFFEQAFFEVFEGDFFVVVGVVFFEVEVHDFDAVFDFFFEAVVVFVFVERDVPGAEAVDEEDGEVGEVFVVDGFGVFFVGVLPEFLYVFVAHVEVSVFEEEFELVVAHEEFLFFFFVFVLVFFFFFFFFGLGFAFFAEFGVDEGFPHDFYQLVDFLDVGDAEGEVDAVVGVVVAFVVGEDLFVLFDGVELFGFAVEVQDSRELEVRLEMQGLAQFVLVEQNAVDQTLEVGEVQTVEQRVVNAFVFDLEAQLGFFQTFPDFEEKLDLVLGDREFVFALEEFDGDEKKFRFVVVFRDGQVFFRESAADFIQNALEKGYTLFLARLVVFVDDDHGVFAFGVFVLGFFRVFVVDGHFIYINYF